MVLGLFASWFSELSGPGFQWRQTALGKAERDSRYNRVLFYNSELKLGAEIEEQGQTGEMDWIIALTQGTFQMKTCIA